MTSATIFVATAVTKSGVSGVTTIEVGRTCRKFARAEVIKNFQRAPGRECKTVSTCLGPPVGLDDGTIMQNSPGTKTRKLLNNDSIRYCHFWFSNWRHLMRPFDR
mmetsp:Transcript_45/g.70  ORF Transcript_45/g.70 Transcript_45/m.70 type:complete len:105 (+) Transcript_45:135-449(+)